MSRSPAARLPVGAAIVLMSTLALAACTGGSNPDPTGSGASGAGSVAPMTVKVMEFNIEYGGSVVDFSGVPQAIRKADPDVVAIEEGYAQMPRIAAALGWRYYDPRTQVVSKYPLLAPSDDSHYDLVEVAPGHVVALANLHLPSAPYGPNLARRGASPAKLVAVEARGRLPMAQEYLHAVAPLVAAGVPTVITGDFNAPSHLDWTPATVGIRSQITHPVAWPVSEAVERAGFVDSYRTLYPDPVTHPGLTWPANRAVRGTYNPYPDHAPRDRIDFIYLSGATPTSSVVVGEPGTAGVDVTSQPWPSDHHAVMTTMTVAPAPAPPLVSVDSRRATRGEPVVVRYQGDGSPGSHLVVVPQGGTVDVAAVADSPVPDGTSAGSTSFDTAGWDPQPYDVVLVAGNGDEIARSTVWVEASDAVTLSTDRRRYRSGAPIHVAWTGAAGNRWDWVSVYPYHARTGSGNYQQWLYTGSTVDGSATIDGRTHGGTWPLSPGRYTLYLLQDDGYQDVAGTDIRVTP